MKPYEFQRIYHPKLGRFVYKHKGSGIIVDNIFKPFKWVASKLGSKVAKEAGKTLMKKAVKSAAESAGDKLGKMAVEKSGDLIQRKLGNKKSNLKNPTQQMTTQQESTDDMVNRLISGSGRKRVKFM